jgi:hypothetical protein
VHHKTSLSSGWHSCFTFGKYWVRSLAWNSTEALLGFSQSQNAEAVSYDSKEDGLQENEEETKYMFMSRHQSAGQNHNAKTSRRFF